MLRSVLNEILVRAPAGLLALMLLALPACNGDGGGDDPPDAGELPRADGGGTLGFMAECDPENDLCDTSSDPELFCFSFNQKGPHCTHDCEMDMDCADPSPGCSGMRMICRAP